MASAKGIFTGSQLPGTLKHLSALGLAGSTEMRGEPDGPQLQSQLCPSVAVPPTAAVRSGQVVPDPPLGETVREPRERPNTEELVLLPPSPHRREEVTSAQTLKRLACVTQESLRNYKNPAHQDIWSPAPNSSPLSSYL